MIKQLLKYATIGALTGMALFGAYNCCDFLPRPPICGENRKLHQVNLNTVKEHMFIMNFMLTVVVRSQGDWKDMLQLEVKLPDDADEGEIEALENHLLVTILCHWNMEWECKPIEVYDVYKNCWITAMWNGAEVAPRSFALFSSNLLDSVVAKVEDCDGKSQVGQFLG